MQNISHFFVRDDLAIVARDPEMADMGNHRGDIEGRAFYVVAESHDGRRWAHEARAYTMIHGTPVDRSWMNDPDCTMTLLVDTGDMTVERLERLATHLNTARPELDESRWTEIHPCYGSPAYMAAERDLVALERMEDDWRWREYR